MNNRGFSTLLMVVIVLVILVIGFFFVYPEIQQNSSQANLQDSDIPGLVSFLQQNAMEAAVVEKLYQSNYDSAWLVKSDGEKILIAKQDLGAYIDKQGLFEGHAAQVNQQFAKGDVALLPDDAQVYSLVSGTSYDISSYLTGYTPDPEWSDAALQKYLAVIYTEDSRLYSAQLSPDGKHVLAGNYENIPFNELMTMTLPSNFSNPNPNPTLIPIARTPLDSFSAWSVDGQYFLGAKTENSNPNEIYTSSSVESEIQSIALVNLGSYVYDISNGELTPVSQESATFMGHEFPSIKPFLSEDINVVGLIPNKSS